MVEIYYFLNNCCSFVHTIFYITYYIITDYCKNYKMQLYILMLYSNLKQYNVLV